MRHTDTEAFSTASLKTMASQKAPQPTPVSIFSRMTRFDQGREGRDY
jgi:hypothetical protein